MANFKRVLCDALSIAASITAVLASAKPAGVVNDIILVHGGFADRSGWKAESDILTSDGYKVSIVQPPVTSLPDDVAANASQ